MTITEPVMTVGSKRRQEVGGEKKLNERYFEQEEFKFARMSATLPVGTTLEDALKPEFWSRVAYRLRPKSSMDSRPRDYAGSIISVRTEDHSMYAELYVRAIGESSLTVALIGQPTYFGLKEVQSDKYRIHWNVGKRGYDVIRNSDGAIVADGIKIKTKEQAQTWIDGMD